MDVSKAPLVFSVGHSTHSLKDFLTLLKPFNVETVVDVRSYPSSKFAPEFSKESLTRTLPAHGYEYVSLGDRLGGRPQRREHYDEQGRALYFKMAKDPLFLEGIQLIERNAPVTRIALMCSEGRPHECHRHLLIERVLTSRGISMTHILPDGSSISLRGQIVSTPSLFSQAEDPSWKSVRSVLPDDRPKASSKA